MTTIKTKTGDLMDAKEDVIAHQVNCYGGAGGLAAAVFEKWPDARNEYQKMLDRFCPEGMDADKSLGARMNLLGAVQLTGQQKDGHIIANLYGQLFPGADYRPDALAYALTRLATIARQEGWSVALPYKLSCGICGGDWKEVRQIIKSTMHGVKCVIYRRPGD